VHCEVFLWFLDIKVKRSIPKGIQRAVYPVAFETSLKADASGSRAYTKITIIKLDFYLKFNIKIA
jgi:hypothetical protein